MKNVTSLKPNNINSPKTPGGISKSLLTPCRRVGLSRNWRKSGPSPFISPLSNATGEVKEEKKETRKRKERAKSEESIEQSPKIPTTDETRTNSDNNDKTPCRSVEVPRKKKSKTLLATIDDSQEDTKSQLDVIGEHYAKEGTPVDTQSVENHIPEVIVSTPVRTKSKKSKKRSSPLRSSPKESKLISASKPDESNGGTPVLDPKNSEAVYTIKDKSPNDLRKECIVVIQRKIFKNVENNHKTSENIMKKDETPLRETNDSDSDDAPLISLHNQNSTKSKTIVIEDDDDFIENKSSKSKPIKSKDIKSPKNKQKSTKPTITKVEKIIVSERPPSQDCFDDEDDDFDNKRTILVRKTYEKVTKPIKAKSTGSITQKDIDNLRNRIEAKKKLLLAQSLNPDTEELRSLIKKWQKGCQDALMELLDLMRNKCPDKQNMDYSEMLRTLKIPPSLVGYDSENDCFNSPADANIILGQFKDL